MRLRFAGGGKVAVLSTRELVVASALDEPPVVLQHVGHLVVHVHRRLQSASRDDREYARRPRARVASPPVRLGGGWEESVKTRRVVVVPYPHLVDRVGRPEAHRAEGDEHHRDGEEHPGHLRTRGVGGGGGGTSARLREAEGRGGATRLDASGRTEGRRMDPFGDGRGIGARMGNRSRG